jgi:hypothetical protein
MKTQVTIPLPVFSFMRKKQFNSLRLLAFAGYV